MSAYKTGDLVLYKNDTAIVFEIGHRKLVIMTSNDREEHVVDIKEVRPIAFNNDCSGALDNLIRSVTLNVTEKITSAGHLTEDGQLLVSVAEIHRIARESMISKPKD